MQKTFELDVVACQQRFFTEAKHALFLKSREGQRFVIARRLCKSDSGTLEVHSPVFVAQVVIVSINFRRWRSYL